MNLPTCPQCGASAAEFHTCRPAPLLRPLSAERRRSLASEILTPPMASDPASPALVRPGASQEVTGGTGTPASPTPETLDPIARHLEEEAERRVAEALLRVLTRKVLRQLPPERRGLAVQENVGQLLASLVPGVLSDLVSKAVEALTSNEVKKEAP